jgi:hypothetical protein
VSGDRLPGDARQEECPKEEREPVVAYVTHQLFVRPTTT